MSSFYYTGARVPRPRLFRIARALRWSALLSTLLVILYIIVAVYSIASGPPTISSGSSSGYGSALSSCTNQTTGGIGSLVTCDFKVQNHAWFALSLQLGIVMQQKNGPQLGRASTPSVTVGGESSATLMLTLRIEAQPQPNSTATTNVWLNGSYASLISIQVTVELQQNFSSVASPVSALPASWAGFPVGPGTGVSHELGLSGPAFPVATAFSVRGAVQRRDFRSRFGGAAWP